MQVSTSRSSDQRAPTLSWSHVYVTAPKQNRRASLDTPIDLLHDVSGYARSGEILAVMGTSGVGKTMLMNLLSGREDNELQTKGEIHLHCRRTTRMQRMRSASLGYVQQNEPFVETMTLEEHLIFQAMLQMPRALTDEERHVRVSYTIDKLYLEKCKSTTINRLSGGEKKRLALAAVLLTDPHILLIDEPTSGLDTYFAKSLVQMIRSMVDERDRTVIVVLHQPTTSMFDQIDKVCLLVHGGRQAFFGNKDEAQHFFKNKCHLPSSTLEYYIEQLAAPRNTDDEYTGVQILAVDQFADSENSRSLHATIERCLVSIENECSTPAAEVERASFGQQLKWLLWRSLVSGKRNPMRTTKLALRLVITAIILGIAFFRLNPRSNDYVQNVNALCVVFLMTLYESNTTLLLVGIPTERSVVTREYKRRMYSVGAYYISRLIIDTLYGVITCVLYITIIVILTGLRRWFLLIIVVTINVMTVSAMATLMASLSKTPRAGLLLLAPIQQILVQFSSYYINLRSVPFYIRWLQYLSHSYYGYSLILMVEWHNIEIPLHCGRTSSHQYITNSTMFTQSANCIRSGDAILRSYDVSDQDFGRNLIALILLAFIFHLGAFTMTVLRIRRAV